jgi:hypothetical protein
MQSAMLLDEAMRLDPNEAGVDILFEFDPYIRVEDAISLFVYTHTYGNQRSMAKGKTAFVQTRLAAQDHPDCKIFSDLVARIYAGKPRN